MNFGSEFVYAYDHSPMASGDESAPNSPVASPTRYYDRYPRTVIGNHDGHTEVNNRIMRQPSPRVGRQPQEVKIVRKKKTRKFDTNIIKVSFDYLLKPTPLTSNVVPPKCSNCPARFFDMVTEVDATTGDNVWTCKYCLSKNTTPEPISEGTYCSGMEFVLKDRAEERKQKSLGKNPSTEGCTIFCVDTSGSMSYYIGEEDAEVVPGEGCSKMRATRAAIRAKINELKDEHRVGIVDFSNIVKVADGSMSKYNIEVNHSVLDDKKSLKKSVKSLKLAPLSKSREHCLNIVDNLKSTTATALGPGLWVALNLAIKTDCAGCKRVVICTDGMSNTGIGNMGMGPMGYGFVPDTSAEFYNECTHLAMANGIVIDIVGFQHCHCQLSELSRMSSNTGGLTALCADESSVLREIVGNEEVEMIRNNVAKNAKLTLVLFKDLYVRNCSDITDESNDTSHPRRDLHHFSRSFVTAFADRNVSMEYGIRRQSNSDLNSSEQGKEMKKMDVDSMENVPFQLLIEYDELFRRVLRVFELTKPVTTDFLKAQEKAMAGTIADHMSSNIGNAMLTGDYRKTTQALRRFEEYSSKTYSDNLDENDEQTVYKANMQQFLKRSKEVCGQIKKVLGNPGSQRGFPSQSNKSAATSSMRSQVRSAIGDSDALYMASAAKGTSCKNFSSAMDYNYYPKPKTFGSSMAGYGPTAPVVDVSQPSTTSDWFSRRAAMTRSAAMSKQPEAPTESEDLLPKDVDVGSLSIAKENHSEETNEKTNEEMNEEKRMLEHLNNIIQQPLSVLTEDSNVLVEGARSVPLEDEQHGVTDSDQD